MMSLPDTTSRDPVATALKLLPGALGIGLVAYAFIAGGYIVTVVSFALIYTIFVTGLNLFMGYTGQVSFGQNAFAAISGYASAILTTEHGWPVLAAIAAGMAGALLFALLIGYPTLRLKGHYLAMATLAIGLIAYEVAVNWPAVTQGYMGISGIPPLGAFGFEVWSPQGNLTLLTVVAALGLVAAALIRHSRLGRAMLAVGGSEDAARALGINVARYKLIAFLLAAGYAALAGSLFVHVVGFVSPEVYGLHMVNLAFTMLYVGGIGTIMGPLVGAIIILLMPEFLRDLKDYQDLAYGAALILILIYAPRGLASLVDLWRPRTRTAKVPAR